MTQLTNTTKKIEYALDETVRPLRAYLYPIAQIHSKQDINAAICWLNNTFEIETEKILIIPQKNVKS